MASSCRLFWMALLLAMMTQCVVRTAPTGAQEELQGPEEFQEAVEEAGKLEDVDEAIEKASGEDEKIDKVEETLLANGGQAAVLQEDGEEDKEIVEDAVDEVINDDDTVENEDVIITGSSSEPDASDYLWEPSLEYDSADGDIDPWFLYDLPYDPSQWSSNFENIDDEYYPYYGSSYESTNEVDGNNLDNSLRYEMPEGVFDGIPGEELNNRVDQTVDEFLCMLGLCDDIRVYPEEEELEEPNEIQFTEEDMMGNNGGDEEFDEKDIYAVDVQPEVQTEEATNTSTSVEVDDASSFRLKRDAPSSPEGSRHRTKRDLSWDELEQETDLLNKIKSLERLQEKGEMAQPDPGLTTADRFEDLLEYFKEEAAENEKAGQEFFLGVPEPVLNEIAADATGVEFQNAIEEKEEEEEDDGIEETGEFIDEDGEVDEDEDDWGPYLAPGSPYSEETLKYDGYKRDDEREALKVYIESLQNLEGYRKRDDPGDYFDDGSRSAANFLRQLVPRSPPNAIRYPKTGLEPFSREKYFPLFPEPDGMADDDDDMMLYPNPEAALEKYNELLELYNTEMEATVLISTIQDMAAELGRDRRLLDELEEEEAEVELQLALDENNREILDLVGIGNIRPMKRAPRVIDYPDFNDYPPEFPRSVPEPLSETNSLSEDELVRLYGEYLNEAAEEAKWGDFIYQPRERREGEDSLPGPHGGYYVQGRMVGDLMKPKRGWEPSSDVDDDLLLGFVPDDVIDQPYVLLEPSDLGYDEWPGDFEIFYDMRDGTYVMYPSPKPQDASVLSDEALLDALGLSGRNFVIGDDEDGNDAGMDEWGDFKDTEDGFQDDLENIDKDIDELENLQMLAEIAEELKIQEDRETEEENLLGVLLGK